MRFVKLTEKYYDVNANTEVRDIYINVSAIVALRRLDTETEIFFERTSFYVVETPEEILIKLPTIGG